MGFVLKPIKLLFGGIVFLVLLLIVAAAVSIFGPGIWASVRGEPDYSVKLPADAAPITERYDVLSFTGEDGHEHPIILPKAQPPLPPPNRFQTGPEARAAENAEEVLRSVGISADVYVVKGASTGEPIMVIAFDLSQGAGSILPRSGQGLEATIDQLIQASRREGTDLAGVSVVIHSEEGEPVVAASTSAGEVRAFRDGEIPMDEAMDHLGLSIIDRSAIIDLLTGLK